MVWNCEINNSHNNKIRGVEAGQRSCSACALDINSIFIVRTGAHTCMMAAQQNLVAKKGTSSPMGVLWLYPKRERSEVVCRTCKQLIRSKDGQTTNLHDHLRIHHPEDHDKLPAAVARERKKTQPQAGQNQPTISGKFAKCTKYKVDSLKWKQRMLSLAFWQVAADMVSFRTVEKPAFLAMLNTFDKQ